MLWYLSFVYDAKGPDPLVAVAQKALGLQPRFLGACIVHAESFDEAVEEAKRLRCHPGGSEVAGGLLPEDAASLVGDMAIGKLLQRDRGLPELDAALGGRASFLDMRPFTVSNHHVIPESTGIRMISARFTAR